MRSSPRRRSCPTGLALALLLTAPLPVEAEDRPLQPCPGDILNIFKRTRLPSTGGLSDRYIVPKKRMLGAIAGSIDQLLAGDFHNAVDLALGAGYVLCAGTGGQEGWILWRPALDGTGGAVFVFRSQGARPVIIEAPHPLFDYGTLEQAMELFEVLEARAVIASGTHRCANRSPTKCRGLTDVCGKLGRYRESDMAHTEDSFFHVAHVVLSERFQDDLVVSLHGKDTRGIRISDGSIAKTSSSSAVARLRSALVELAPKESIQGCNQWHKKSPAGRLCGASNVQGRHLNGLPPCTATATVSTGRFVHVEQSRRFRKRSTMVLALALDAVVPKTWSAARSLADRAISWWIPPGADTSSTATTAGEGSASGRSLSP